MTNTRINWVCAECGSESVLKDAYAQWSTVDQVWELANEFDENYCPDCDGHVELAEIPLERSGRTAQ